MKLSKKKTASIVSLTIFLLFLFLMSDLIPQSVSTAVNDSRKLIQEGKSLYAEGNYNEALVKFLEALTKAASIQEKAEAQLNLSLVHFALGNGEKAREYLEGLFHIMPSYSIVEVEYPQEYVDLYKQAKSATVGPEWKGKPGKEKPAKKKTIWFVIGGVVAAGAGIAIYLLTRKPEVRKPEVLKFGDIAITSDPVGAKVFLDGADTGKTSNCTLTNIAVGNHKLLLLLENYGKWEGDVEVKGGQTANISCKLAGFIYEFVTKWGSQGSGDGQFSYPYGVAVDNSGYVYVADTNNNRIQKFTSNGSFVTKWGSEGDHDRQFNYPHGIAMDNSGYIFVADSLNHRIQKFTSNGLFVAKWGSYGSGDGQFCNPSGIAIDNSGYVFVADTNWNRIQKLTSNGSFVTKWGSWGCGDGQFGNPWGIAIDNSGYVFVADYCNRIQKFTSNGLFVAKWGSYESGDGQFYNPSGIAIDNSGYVFVADSYNHRIQKFTSNGSFVTKWGSEGDGDGQFNYPHGIAMDNSGYVFVADSSNHRIQKFQMTSETQAEAIITYSSISGLRDISSRPTSISSHSRSIDETESHDKRLGPRNKKDIK